MSIYIPACGEGEEIIFSPQIFGINNTTDNIIITGLIDQEIEQSVFLTLSLCLKKDLFIPNYLHIHFPDYCRMKCGISASLGVFMSIYCYLTNKQLKKNYLLTGEIDLEGNIYPIGQLIDKIDIFKKNKIDYFFIPNQDCTEEYKNILKVKNIDEVISLINKAEENEI